MLAALGESYGFGRRAATHILSQVLTASRELSRYIDQQLRSFKVAGSTTIYKGALVSIQTDGYVAPLTAAELFAGIAYEEIVNAGADGAKSVRIYTQGDFAQRPVRSGDRQRR